MNSLRLLLLGFSLFGFVGCGTTASPSFSITRQQFESGDAITIDQVESTKTAAGRVEQMIVRGHYRLRSRAKAKLSLFVTTRGPSGVTRVDPSQTMEIVAGDGTFELKNAHGREGSSHVSFYEFPYGNSFDGIYFAPKS